MISGRLESGAGRRDNGRRLNPTRQTPVLEKSALHPVCQQTGVTGFRAQRGGNLSDLHSAACSASETGEELSCYFYVHSGITGLGVYFKLLRKQIFSSLELAEEPTDLSCFSLVPGRNRESWLEDHASRGRGQGKKRCARRFATGGLGVPGSLPQPRTRLSMNGSSPSPTRDTLSRSAATIATTSA